MIKEVISSKNLNRRSVIQFESLFQSKKDINNDFHIDDNDKKQIFQSKYINPIDEEIKKIEKSLHLTKRNYNDYNNKKLLLQVQEDIPAIESILEENNEGLNEEKKISFLNVICFILKKINKKLIENEILKTYFLNFEKLVNLFLPLNVNINDMMARLVGQIKYEKKSKNKILFKEGDKGDKFFIILKGELGILIPQEKIINCCPSEYLKYLIFLYLYQEKSLINKLLIANREILKYDERIFYSLMDGLKFYHFFIYYSGTKRNYKNPIDFLHIESKINNYIRKKNDDFSPEQAFHALNLTNISEEIYEYYHKQLNNIHSIFLTSLNDKRGRQEVFSISSATNLSEFGEFIKEYQHDKKKLKENEFFDKLYHINELSSNFTYSCTTESYIERINCERKMKDITNDIRNNIIKINEKPINLKYFNYVEVNQLKDKNIFGELALINPNQKRTATIIMKDNCHFGVLDKESYEISIKTAHEKSRMRNLLYFTNGFLFKGLTNNYFLNNYFFRFKRKTYNSGEFLFRRGQKRNKIYFIINGELELGGKMTLKKITSIIGWLEGKVRWDDGGVLVKYCKESIDFIKYYEEAQNYFRFYVLKKKEIAGLDDMVQNGIYLFDCMAISSEPTEVYEFDYKIYETCLEERIVAINNDNYVSTKKKLIIDRLYKQRDSIANNEFSRIKIYILNKNNQKNNQLKDKDDINEDKNRKIEKKNFPLNNTFFNKNIFSFIEESKFNSKNINNNSNHLYKKLPYLFSNENLHTFEEKLKIDLNFGKTEYLKYTNNFNIQNRKIITKSNTSDNSSINNNQFLIKLEKNKEKKDKDIINLLKSDNININKIASYLNKSSFSFPKLKGNSPKKIEEKILFAFKKFSNKKQNQIEINKTIYNKQKFEFNNQKIFSLLLNHMKKDCQNTTNKNSNNDNSINKDDEDNKEGLIKEKEKNKIINTEIKEYQNYKRNKRKVNLSITENNSQNIRKFIKNNFDEDFKNIFQIDCLCLDKWEEKNNKFTKKKISKLKGKKCRIFIHE